MASVGMAASAEAKTHVEAEARVELPVEVKVVAQAVAGASVSCLAEVRARLLAAGAIKVEDEPDPEEDFPEAEDEGEFDSSDEDAEREVEPDGGREMVSDPFADVFRRDAFEIKVVRTAGGGCQCEAPQSGWEGVVGVSTYGKTVVNAVSNRMQVYLLLAMWLEESRQDFLKRGPFGWNEPIGTRKELLAGPLMDLLGKAEDGGASSLSRYLENVDLVWPDGALPLKSCFGGCN